MLHTSAFLKLPTWTQKQLQPQLTVRPNIGNLPLPSGFVFPPKSSIVFSKSLSFSLTSNRQTVSRFRSWPRYTKQEKENRIRAFSSASKHFRISSNKLFTRSLFPVQKSGAGCRKLLELVPSLSFLVLFDLSNSVATWSIGRSDAQTKYLCLLLPARYIRTSQRISDSFTFFSFLSS